MSFYLKKKKEEEEEEGGLGSVVSTRAVFKGYILCRKTGVLTMKQI